MENLNINSLISSTINAHSGVEAPPTGEDLFESLSLTLGDLHKSLKDNPDRTNIEIEVRVGLIAFKDLNDKDNIVRSKPGKPGLGAFTLQSNEMRTLKFESGVSSKDYETMKEEIGSVLPHPTSTITEERVYFYEKSGERVTSDGIKFAREKKEAIHQVNLQLPASPYDIRVQSSLEKPMGEETSVAPGWSTRRTKKRVSSQSYQNSWRADMTFVEELSAETGLLRKTWEVEFELLSIDRDAWLSKSDPAEINKITSRMAHHLVDILEKLNPMEPVSSISNPTQELDARINTSVQQALFKLTGKSSFPGAQPANMRKKDVSKVQSMPYYVAEKTDGVRYLMLSIPIEGGKTCVLVDRSSNVFKVEGGEFIAEILGVGTILDGELVHNRTSMKSVFVAFDILQRDETNVMGLNFTERFSTLGNVMEIYSSQKNEVGEHLTLVRKTFYPRAKIMDLFRNIHVEGRHRIFKHRTLHHKTDGVIFQPNLPYTSGTDLSLLKWKWTDLASVDLRVKMGEDLQFFSTAGSNVDVNLSDSIHLSIHDRARLIGDIGRSSAIAEVALDPVSGLWVYMCLRTHKNTPNFITVVMSTMMEVAEGLSEDELKFRMLADKSNDDDWAIQENSMRKRAVQWKYSAGNKKQK